MNLRSFRAPTMREAMQQVKDALGPEAIILNTREIRTGRNPLVEITVAQDYVEEFAGPSSTNRSNDWNGPTPEFLNKVMTELGGMRRELTRLRAERAVATQATRQWDRLMSDMKGVARLMGLTPDSDCPESALVMRLVAGGVEAALAQSMVERVTRGIKDMQDRTRAVAAEIRDAFTSAPPIWQRNQRSVAAFVGPTGVGKTTTLAKIAAKASIEHGKKVAIVAADTYRIASVDQIQAYADLLGTPWAVATGPEEMTQALKRFENADLVLVDTAGRNPWCDDTFDDLERLIGSVPVERHLCVSATSSGADLAQIVDRYNAGGVRSLVITKIDEARALGGMLSTVWGTDLQIAHLTNGQEVPQDIMTPDADELCQAVLG
ncbi:MAG TPA: flagellar biosynthesis protein FlhF [Myxococcales bacterium]|nr:flagellar biosynthesis protein FlhF [Myxococcales bacterium]HIN86910.1 flagellar biosynthesis protein FlhF [Myxococcales bacterium]